MNQLSEQRLGEILAALESVEDGLGEDGEEIRALVREVRERRKQAPLSREQRFGFMIRMVKDAMPEVARELREIYEEQNNAIYYARRDADYWRRECENNGARASDLRGYLQNAMAFINPESAGDYELWKRALEP